MRLDSLGACLNNIFHHFLFIVGFRFSFFNRYGALRTMAYAGAQPVAKKIAYKPCFPVRHLQSAFGAIRYAQPAAIAFAFVNPYNFSFHGFPLFTRLPGLDSRSFLRVPMEIPLNSSFSFLSTAFMRALNTQRPRSGQILFLNMQSAISILP